jgi:uncharacterized protein (TIGR02147 family)
MRFLDYHEFLHSLYSKVKDELGTKYSWLIFAEDLGFGRCNVAWLIAHGKRPLTEHTAGALCHKLNLTGASRKYLFSLMAYQDANDVLTREISLSEMIAFKREVVSEERQTSLDFFGHWYHPIIFELVALADFSPNPEWIVARLRSKITLEEANESLLLLERIQVLSRNTETGLLQKRVENMSTGPRADGIGVVSYHRKMIDLGKSAIDSVPPELREIGSVTMAISTDKIPQIKEIIRNFKQQLVALANEEQQTDEVVQVNIQMFPLTQKQQSHNGRKKYAKKASSPQ